VCFVLDLWPVIFREEKDKKNVNIYQTVVNDADELQKETRLMEVNLQQAWYLLEHASIFNETRRGLCGSIRTIHPSNGSTAQIRPWPPPLRFLNHTQLDTR
jgi:hypothetical protein